MSKYDSIQTAAERRACTAEAQVLALKARLYDYITAEA